MLDSIRFPEDVLECSSLTKTCRSVSRSAGRLSRYALGHSSPAIAKASPRFVFRSGATDSSRRIESSRAVIRSRVSADRSSRRNPAGSGPPRRLTEHWRPRRPEGDPAAQFRSGFRHLREHCSCEDRARRSGLPFYTLEIHTSNSITSNSDRVRPLICAQARCQLVLKVARRSALRQRRRGDYIQERFPDFFKRPLV